MLRTTGSKRTAGGLEKAKKLLAKLAEYRPLAKVEEREEKPPEVRTPSKRQSMGVDD